MAQGLNEVIWHSIVSSHSGSPDAEAVAGEVTWDVRRCQDLPKPVRKQGTRERLPILEQKQGTGDVTRVRYDSTEFTVQSGGQPRPMLIKAPFLKGSGFEPLILKCMHEGADRESTAMSWTPK